jgi:hypothetical protein
LNFVPGVGVAKAGIKVLGKVATKLGPAGSKVAKACGSSFAPGTLVLIADGSHKPIEEVQIGDHVMATDPLTGETAAKEVTDLIVGTGIKDLIEITATPGGGYDSSLTATAEHPFWVPTSKQWVKAVDLAPGMWLRTSAGTYVQVGAIKQQTAVQRVYNMTVGDLHTYYVLVGVVPVLVHNTNCPIGFIADVVSDAFTGMNKGGGHAMRHLIKAGLIPNKGSVASQVAYFQKNFSQILTSPQKTFDWKIGGTQARAFAGRVDGKMVVLFVAKEGPYQGKVLSSVVPGPDNMAKWGLS